MRRLVVAAALAALLVAACGHGVDEDEAVVAVIPVTFAVVGNTGRDIDDGSSSRLLAARIAGQGPDFVVDLGNRLPPWADGTRVAPLWEAVDRDRALYGAPVYTVVGPDDVFDYASDVTYFERYGPAWYSFMRGGIRFIVPALGEESYRHGFGTDARITPEQSAWLDTVSADPRETVAFLGLPVWRDAPDLWRRVLLPRFRAAGVRLIVALSDDGLCDEGEVDGIRVVMTGCTGPVDRTAPGLFAHALMVTVGAGEPSFTVLTPDSLRADGIMVTASDVAAVAALAASLEPPPLRSEVSWRISDSFAPKITNPFDGVLEGRLGFAVYPGTDWRIEPDSFAFAMEPGERRTFNIGIEGRPPELGPHPRVTWELSLDGTPVFRAEKSLEVAIPTPRTSETIPIGAIAPQTVPYSFGGARFAVPIEIETPDVCGRLVIYDEQDTEVPVCLHVSPLRDLRQGMNEFVWNGRDLDGNAVPPGTLAYRLFLYNKKAPPTWVADGPRRKNGTFLVERTLAGLRALTHDDHAILSCRIDASMERPVTEPIIDLSGVLGGETMTGFCFGDGGRLYAGTPHGVCALFNRTDGLILDTTFGDEGYVRFEGSHGREVGPPVISRGVLAVGVGGGYGRPPGIVMMDAVTGDIGPYIDCGEDFGASADPPSVAASPQGFVCAHPDAATVFALSPEGALIWLNDADGAITGLDADGRSFAWSVGVGDGGFSYVTTPGTSARCAVLGPDGRGLFRVILVILPGLRVSAPVPVVEGRATDGLYFVTRGGDRPYVFHVPFTVRTGLIVDEAAALP